MEEATLGSLDWTCHEAGNLSPRQVSCAWRTRENSPSRSGLPRAMNARRGT
jgi:hypothetical protein